MGFEEYTIRLDQLSEAAQVYFISNTPEIATVSSEGIISPIQKGEAIIYVHVVQDNMVYQFEMEISVKDPYLKLSASNKELTVGEQIKIKAKQYGIKEAVSWQVSNHKIATINEKTGELYARKQGTVTVTAKISTGLSAKLKIKVI
jgi:uncharacterized protein YjdB